MAARRLIAMALGTLLCGGWGFSRAPSPGSAADEVLDTGRVTLTLRIVPRIAGGGSIYAIVGVRNESSHSLWLNTRFVAILPFPLGKKSNIDNLWFDIKYQKDQPVVYRCALPNGPREFKASDFRVLESGQSVDSDKELSCFDLSRLGEYTIVAHYFDRSTGMPAAPGQAIRVNWELVSAPVVFSVMGG